MQSMSDELSVRLNLYRHGMEVLREYPAHVRYRAGMAFWRYLSAR